MNETKIERRERDVGISMNDCIEIALMAWYNSRSYKLPIPSFFAPGYIFAFKHSNDISAIDSDPTMPPYEVFGR